MLNKTHDERLLEIEAIVSRHSQFIQRAMERITELESVIAAQTLPKTDAANHDQENAPAAESDQQGTQD
jgi:hypothetical protein